MFPVYLLIWILSELKFGTGYEIALARRSSSFVFLFICFLEWFITKRTPAGADTGRFHHLGRPEIK